MSLAEMASGIVAATLVLSVPWFVSRNLRRGVGIVCIVLLVHGFRMYGSMRSMRCCSCEHTNFGCEVV